MAVIIDLMTAAGLGEALAATGTFDSVASAVAAGYEVLGSGTVGGGIIHIFGGAAEAVTSSTATALELAGQAELAAAATEVDTAATALLSAGGGAAKVAGASFLSMGTVAAIAAPIAGVGLGIGMYESNPKLWTDISQKLLPFCYPGTTQIPTWIDIIEDAITGSIEYKVLVKLGIIDAIKNLFSDEGIGQDTSYTGGGYTVPVSNTVIGRTSTNREISYTSTASCYHYPGYPGASRQNEFVSLEPFTVTIIEQNLNPRTVSAISSTIRDYSNIARTFYRYGANPYTIVSEPAPVSPVDTASLDPYRRAILFGEEVTGGYPDGTSEWGGTTITQPEVYPYPIIIIPDPIDIPGPGEEPETEPLTPITVPEPLPEPVQPTEPVPYEPPEEWPEEEPWPVVIPFPWEDPTPDPSEPWPEVMPWPLPPVRPEEWPTHPDEWDWPEELPWPRTPEEWPETVPWPTSPPDPEEWPETEPWPGTPEEWPEEIPWPVPWPEDWPETEPWPIQWPEELPYPDIFPLPDPSPDPEIQPDPTEITDPEKQIDPIIQPYPIPEPYPEPDPVQPQPQPEPQPDPQEDPSQPEPQPWVVPAPVPDPPIVDPPPDGLSPDIIPPYVPVPFTSSAGLISVYHPTQAELIAFAQWLWVTWQDATIEKIWNNPFDGIITLFELYCTPTDIGRKTIRSGFLDSEVSSQTISRYTEINCGTVGVPEYYGNYLDYAPYTKAYIYLPFIGVVELNSDDIVGHAVNVTYKIDEYNGSCIAMITVAKVTTVNGEQVEYSNLFYQYSGNCAVELPIAGGSQAAIKAGMMQAAAYGISSVISGVISGASSGGLAGAIGGLASGVAYGAANAVGSLVSAKSSVQHSGSFGSSYGALGCKIPFITVVRPKQIQVPNYNKLYGYQAHKLVHIGSCSGYLRCREVHVLSATANEEEKTLIEQLLKAGVYVTE